MPHTIAATPLLRFALLGDAAASGATGLLMSSAAGPLASLLGLPRPLLLWAGLMLLPYAAFVGWLSRQEAVRISLVRIVIVLNAVWALDSVLLLLSNWIQPTALGIAFVLIQAAVVALFAGLQCIALRRSGRAAMAVA